MARCAQQTRVPRSRCSCTIMTSRATAQSVTRELVSRVELGASIELEWTVGPVDHWHQDGPEALGVILKHPRRNKFLKNLFLTQELVYMYIYIYIYV